MALTANGVIAGAAIGTLAVATWQLRRFVWSERRRTQPVVVVHEVRPRDLANDRRGGSVFTLRLTNEGTGTAFNVRFGVDLDGTRYVFGGAAGGIGARLVAIRQGGREPVDGSSYGLRVPWDPWLICRRGRDVDSRRVFWARYENAFGETWETRNPWNPHKRTQIRRVGRIRAWGLEGREHLSRVTDAGIASLVDAEIAQELRALATPPPPAG